MSTSRRDRRRGWEFLGTAENVRLYPVPFRALPFEQRFKKWDRIRVRARTPNNDTRPESFSPDTGSITMLGHLDTAQRWKSRRSIVDQLPKHSMCGPRAEQAERGTSLGLVVPSEILDFTVEEREPDEREELVGSSLHNRPCSTRRSRPRRQMANAENLERQVWSRCEWVRRTGTATRQARNKTTQQDHEGVRMGAIDDIKGRAKKALGDLTDNNKLKQEGKADRATGKVKDAADAVSDKVKDAADALRKKTD